MKYSALEMNHSVTVMDRSVLVANHAEFDLTGLDLPVAVVQHYLELPDRR